MSKWKETGLPCPCGKSSDAYSIDKRGNGYCFSGQCESPSFPNLKPREEDLTDKTVEYDYYPWRGLNLRTLQHYDVQTRFVDEKPIDVGFVYPNGAVQIRGIEEKSFRIRGDISDNPLWGMDKFDPGALDSVTITEGHLDAMSIFQVTGGRTAALSIRSTATALKECSNEKVREYLNRFKRIVLAFDNDTPGKAAAEAVAPLFDFRKVYFVTFNKYKDANDYLQHNEGEDLFKVWESAKRYSPDNIISSFSDVRKMLADKQDERVGTYPVQRLQDMLKGFHAGEVVTIKAPEGVGKTEIFRMMEFHLLKTTEHPIGIMHFEESNNTSIRGIATYQSQMPMAMGEEETGITQEEVMAAYTEAVGGREDRLYIRKSYDMEDTQGIVDSIRYMVAGCGCRIVFFDHISWLAAANEGDDERKKLDALIQRLKLLAEELRFCLVLISHVNDEGKTRGSRYISKASNTVIALFRDIATPDVEERRRTYITVEKGRGQGTQTGPAGHVYYDPFKYILIDEGAQND